MLNRWRAHRARRSIRALEASLHERDRLDLELAALRAEMADNQRRILAIAQEQSSAMLEALLRIHGYDA